jgi:hypothetical protein
VESDVDVHNRSEVGEASVRDDSKDGDEGLEDQVVHLSSLICD